jgi:hypothetical protein
MIEGIIKDISYKKNEEIDELKNEIKSKDDKIYSLTMKEELL